jgi:hypothetical protein
MRRTYQAAVKFLRGRSFAEARQNASTIRFGPLGAGLVSLTAVVLSVTLARAYLSGPGISPPPATGAFAYNSFVPPLTSGTIYIDPVLGETVRRLTTDHGQDDLYVRNMWWNADETRYLHTAPGAGQSYVIGVATGTVTHTIPVGHPSYDDGFDPVDPAVVYYIRPDGLHKVTLGVAGAFTDVLYFAPPAGATLLPLGGSINWFDASGRYMLVRYGSEPSVHLYDRQNMAAGPYANPVSGAATAGSGSYVGLSPDGQYIVGFESGSFGVNGGGWGVSWKIDHTTRTIAPAPTIFWSNCGDHGSFLSASDGRIYMITYDCHTQAGLWRADITNNANGLNEAQQLALPNNRLLLAYPTWNDFGHVSTVARGPLQDWAFFSTEDGTDVVNGPVSPWHAYRQEIIAVNVITGEIRRLAHHRSRSVDADYYNQPRLSVGWGGKVVGFASNFNQSGVTDIYAIPLAWGLAPSPPSTLTVR